MAYRLVNVAPDPNAKPFSLFDWLSGYKTYAVTIVGVAKVWYVAVYGHPWSDNIDNAINITLLLLFGATIRSAINTSTAKVANAVVNPTSEAAKATAAEAPGAPPAPVPAPPKV